jgi:hypothetical protein
VEEIDSGLVIMIVLMLGMFWDMGIPMVLWFKNHRLKFNQTDIEVINVYGQRNSIAWKEINSISFNHFSGFITITDPKGTRLKAHQHLVGLSVFTNMMEAKTLWTVEELRLPIKTKNAA